MMHFIERQQAPQVDRVIVFASYEERSARVARDLHELGYKGALDVFYCEDLACDATGKNLGLIGDLFRSTCRVLPVSYRDPTRIIRITRSGRADTRLLIDASCFNRGNLFPFLWASRLGMEKFPQLAFAYSAPEHYGEWLSGDYEEPANFLGYAGALRFSKERVLMCLVGYETQRALEVIRAAEPSRVILLVGGIPTRKEFLDRNREAVKEVLGSERYEVVEVDVSSPEGCLADLAQLLTSVTEGQSVQVAPFNTKLSCLAVWALWLKHPGIRMWNAQPKVYNELNYSRGSTEPRYFEVQWRD